MSVYMDAVVVVTDEIVMSKDRGANAAMKTIEHQCVNNSSIE